MFLFYFATLTVLRLDCITQWLIENNIVPLENLRLSLRKFFFCVRFVDLIFVVLKVKAFYII
jgi:hypothetical protein